MILINSKDDMEWLRDVHLPGLPKRYKSAVIHGNADYPDRIEVYKRKMPLITDPSLPFEPDNDGNYRIV